MSRAHISYTDARPASHVFDGASVSEPVAGFYRFRLVSGGVTGGVRLWYGPPRDPVTGALLDRSWRWQSEFDGEPIDLDRVWPDCMGRPITEAEYRALVARREWARQHAPHSAYAERTRRHDPLSSETPLPF